MFYFNMSGIYGNVLDHFPELFTSVSFWEMEKLDPKGFGPKTNEREIAVIVLNAAGDQIKRKKLVDEWLLDSASNDVMYSYDDADIKLGTFLVHPHTRETNRVEKRFSYGTTGGMMVWGIQKVQGEDYLDPKTLKPLGGTF